MKKKKIQSKQFSRRDFLIKSAVATAGATAASYCGTVNKQKIKTRPKVTPAKAIDVVRVGFVGVGGMGSAHCRNLLGIEGVEIRAVCDIVESKVERIQRWCVDVCTGRY